MEEVKKRYEFVFKSPLALLFILFAPALILLFLPTAVLAASLSFSPSSGSFQIGKTLSAGVYLASADQAINAVSGEIAFSADLLEVSSISKAGSIVNLWVQEPSFSASAGAINFEGVILNPGFTGASGKIITVTFKVKRAGEATVNFVSGSILANDGLGTNVLSGFGSANFILAAEEVGAAPPEASPSVSRTPLAPQVFSLTHQDPDKWYASKNPTFSWALPKGTIGVNVLADRNPSTNPGTKSDGLRSSYAFKNVDEGVWYFHIRLRNNAGWGDIAHFRFQIDAEKPDLLIEEIKNEKTGDPAALFKFNAIDKTSGIDFFEIKIDDEAPETWKDDGTGVYKTKFLKPGNHRLLVKVHDGALNFSEKSAEFQIKAILPPEITAYPDKLKTTDKLIISGKCSALADIIIRMQKDNELMSGIVQCSSTGEFRYAHDRKLAVGSYLVWAEAITPEGARSEPSRQVNIAVEQTFLEKVISFIKDIVYAKIPFGLLIAVLILRILATKLNRVLKMFFNGKKYASKSRKQKLESRK